MLKGTPQLRKHPACIVQLILFFTQMFNNRYVANYRIQFFHHIAIGAGTLGKSFQNLTIKKIVSFQTPIS
jgi:hypothetical protein